MRHLVVVAATALALSGCHAIGEQKRTRSSPASPQLQAAPDATRTAAADRSITEQFERQTPAAKQATLIAQLDAYKAELAEAGKYDCCVRPGCNECVIRTGECHCRVAVERSGPCCGECTAAWIEGRGTVPGIDKEQILESLGCHAGLYTRSPDDAASQEPPGQR